MKKPAKVSNDDEIWFDAKRLFSARSLLITSLLICAMLMLGTKLWQIATIAVILHLAHVARLESRKIEVGAFAFFVLVAAWWVDVRPFNIIYRQIGKQIESEISGG